jgi:hypothetical protein
VAAEEAAIKANKAQDRQAKVQAAKEEGGWKAVAKVRQGGLIGCLVDDGWWGRTDGCVLCERTDVIYA